MNLPLAVLAMLLAVVLSCPAVVHAEDGASTRSVGEGEGPIADDDPSFPDLPDLPDVFVRDSVRFWAGSSFAPSADFGDVDLSLLRPELRMKARVGVSETLSAQLIADFRMSHYDIDGSAPLYEDCVDCPEPGNLYAISVAAQGGYLLNRRWTLFRDPEQWALLGAAYLSARWEPGAFEESLSPGVSIGLGYQIPGMLRIALAARVERALDGDGVSVGPSGYLRWDFAPNFQLRNRGLGLQLEYRAAKKWEMFVTGFRASDRFRMDDRPGAPSGLTFHDRQVNVGGGLVFKLHHSLRLAAEAGAIVDRRVAMDSRGDRLDSVDGDVSPYFSVRFEIRP